MTVYVDTCSRETESSVTDLNALTVFDVIYLIDETLVGELRGERGHKVDRAVQEDEGVHIWNHLLLAGLGLRPFQLTLNTL